MNKWNNRNESTFHSLRVWHYTGECIYERLYEAKQELWEVLFRPSSTRRRFEPVFVNAEQRRMAGLDARGKVRALSITSSTHTPLPQVQANGVHPADGLVNKSGAYVPPHMRGQFSLHNRTTDLITTAGASGKPSVSVPQLVQARKPPEGMQAPAKPAKSETEKRKLKLEKTLQQIEKLKARHQRGEKLEANQVQHCCELLYTGLSNAQQLQIIKMETYDEVVKELAALSTS